MNSMTIYNYFLKETATTEIYTLPLHDALPIYREHRLDAAPEVPRHPVRAGEQHLRIAAVLEVEDAAVLEEPVDDAGHPDRKSTRLNSSHSQISYAVLCLKKKQHTTTDNSDFPI